MNRTALELALKKQRLQIASETLRAEFGRYAGGLAPAFTGADYAVVGARWVQRHPQFVVAAAVALVVARPKRAWRWARRAFVGWQAWHKLRDILERRQPPIPPP
ncbi:MAG: YqjK family protein [Sulfuritalea sp.]|nr:YqjK family protein [Sulfuritalea sp.]